MRNLSYTVCIHSIERIDSYLHNAVLADADAAHLADRVLSTNWEVMSYILSSKGVQENEKTDSTNGVDVQLSRPSGAGSDSFSHHGSATACQSLEGA